MELQLPDHSTLHISDCPWCANNSSMDFGQDYKGYAEMDHDDDWWFVICMYCGASGPRGKDVDEAISMYCENVPQKFVYKRYNNNLVVKQGILRVRAYLPEEYRWEIDSPLDDWRKKMVYWDSEKNELTVHWRTK